jgi:hypothetical protein
MQTAIDNNEAKIGSPNRAVSVEPTIAMLWAGVQLSAIDEEDSHSGLAI